MGGLSQPHDHFFKLLLENPTAAGALLHERLPPDVVELLSDDPPRPEEGSVIDAAFQGSESDRLFSLRLRDGEHLLVYCLIEHQSRPDPRMPLRLLGYMLRIHEQWAAAHPGDRLPPILPIVVYHGEAKWTVPLTFSGMLSGDARLHRHGIDFGYTLVDLQQFDDPQLSKERRLRLGLMALKYASRLGEQLEALDRIAALAAELPEMQWMVWFYIIDAYGAVDAPTLDATWRKHMPNLDVEHASLAAKKWFAEGKAEGMAEGRAEGKAEGKVEGKAEGKAESLLRLLNRRFGDVPDRVRQKVLGADVGLLDRWLDAVLDAKTLEEVLAERTGH